MKNVFKTDEVAHIWAQQKQDEGRNAQGNFYFTGKTIFSYGGHFPIASFVAPGVVLITTRGYSNTTAKHIWAVRDAIRHLKVYEGHEVPVDNMFGLYPHAGNLERFIADFPRQQKAAVKSRKYGDQERAKLSADIRRAVEYAAYFKKGISKANRAALKVWADKEKTGRLFSDKELLKIKAVVKEETAAAKVRNAERRAIEAARLAEQRRTREENLMRWLAGESVNSYNLPTDGVRLRIIGDEIQTTRGAAIPLSAARTLWDRLTTQKPVHGLELGNYTVTSFDGSALVVGCHNIPMREVYRMARALKWANDDGASLEAVQQ